MTRILITGAGSYIGTSVRNWLEQSNDFHVDEVDTMHNRWKSVDFSQYDVVYHVAGIAHVNAAPEMEPLYYQVNRDLTIEIATAAKNAGVKQFIFMSSMIVFHESQSLSAEIITAETKPCPNGFYGDSKLQAEIGLHHLESDSFKICILRPPMVYGPGAKGNFPRLKKLAITTPIFPALHNKRSMIYIDNLAEFVKQSIVRNLSGTFYPQNKELSDTVEIVRFFANSASHSIWITSLLNPFVRIAAKVLQPLNKMFATYYYDPAMSKMEFDYQIVNLPDSLEKMK